MKVPLGTIELAGFLRLRGGAAVVNGLEYPENWAARVFLLSLNARLGLGMSTTECRYSMTPGGELLDCHSIARVVAGMEKPLSTAARVADGVIVLDCRTIETPHSLSSHHALISGVESRGGIFWFLKQESAADRASLPVLCLAGHERLLVTVADVDEFHCDYERVRQSTYGAAPIPSRFARQHGVSADVAGGAAALLAFDDRSFWFRLKDQIGRGVRRLGGLRKAPDDSGASVSWPH